MLAASKRGHHVGFVDDNDIGVATTPDLSFEQEILHAPQGDEKTLAELHHFLSPSDMPEVWTTATIHFHVRQQSAADSMVMRVSKLRPLPMVLEQICGRQGVSPWGYKMLVGDKVVHKGKDMLLNFSKGLECRGVVEDVSCLPA